MAAPEPSAAAEGRPPFGATGSRRSCSPVGRRSPGSRSVYTREGTLEVKAQQLAERERSLDDRRRNLDHVREELKDVKTRQIRESSSAWRA